MLLNVVCSGNRKQAVVGFQNGSIRVYLLTGQKDSFGRTEKATFARLGPHWSGWAHDHDYGDVSSLAFSHDDRYIFSTGLDGNFFVFMTADTAKWFSRVYTEPERIPSHTVGGVHRSYVFY